MNSKSFENELKKLQVELCRLQEWVRQTGARIQGCGFARAQRPREVEVVIFDRSWYNRLAVEDVPELPPSRDISEADSILNFQHTVPEKY